MQRSSPSTSRSGLAGSLDSPSACASSRCVLVSGQVRSYEVTSRGMNQSVSQALEGLTDCIYESVRQSVSQSVIHTEISEPVNLIFLQCSVKSVRRK